MKEEIPYPDVFPERKRNRLECYDYSTPGMYFITICTSGKEKLLGEVVDRNEDQGPYVRLSAFGSIVDSQIQTICRTRSVQVVKYVVMPNHIHFILSVEDQQNFEHDPPNAVIPKTIGGFKRLCRRKIGSNIFQRSYHDHIIRDEKHFSVIWNYIEDNPRRWKEDCFFVK